MSESNGFVNAGDVFSRGSQRETKELTVQGMKFRFKPPNSLQVGTWLRENSTKQGKYTANERLIVICLVNEDDTPMFSAADVSRLQQLDCGLIAELAERCFELSGLQREEVPEKN